MHPLEHAALDELAQVAAYGLRGDVEVVGEAGDLDPAVVPGAGQDLSLSLVSLHRERLLGARVSITFTVVLRPFPGVTWVTSLSLQQVGRMR